MATIVRQGSSADKVAALGTLFRQWAPYGYAPYARRVTMGGAAPGPEGRVVPQPSPATLQPQQPPAFMDAFAVVQRSSRSSKCLPDALTVDVKPLPDLGLSPRGSLPAKASLGEPLLTPTSSLTAEGSKAPLLAARSSLPKRETLCPTGAYEPLMFSP